MEGPVPSSIAGTGPVSSGGVSHPCRPPDSVAGLEVSLSGRKPAMSHPRDGERGYPPLPHRFTPTGYEFAWFLLGLVGLSLLPPAARGADEPLSLRGHTKQVSGLAFSPDGSRLLSGGNDGKLLLWDLKGRRRTAFPDEHGEVLAVAFAPDGGAAASAGSGRLRRPGSPQRPPPVRPRARRRRPVHGRPPPAWLRGAAAAGHRRPERARLVGGGAPGRRRDAGA